MPGLMKLTYNIDMAVDANAKAVAASAGCKCKGQLTPFRYFRCFRLIGTAAHKWYNIRYGQFVLFSCNDGFRPVSYLIETME